MIPDRSPDLFRRLKPLYGKKIDVLWYEYQTADVERKREIEGLLTLIAAKRLGMAVGEERIALEPPPVSLIGQGAYTVGDVSYPGMLPFPFRLGPQELLRHTFILGPTGTGKSTLIIGLLQQLLRDGVPLMVFDFKRNYRCLLPANDELLVVTVGRDVAPLAVNALQPPPGVAFDEWAQALSDVIGNAYLLMQGAGNVLKEALAQASRERGAEATLADAHRLVTLELRTLRPGSRRYGWLESTERSLDELSKAGFGTSINHPAGATLASFLEHPVVFELQGLGDDQKRFFCLYVLQYLLLFRKNEGAAREVFRHVLVFDESHNVFPKDQYGEHSVPSRLAREVREYGEAIIAATQQTDVSESLIANSGTKIILRTDFPRDVDFASKLLQVKPEWLSKLPLGMGIARLPTRFYQPFVFTFAEQPQKNAPVEDGAVALRWLGSGLLRAALPGHCTAPVVGDRERELVLDIARHPISMVTDRYQRLGWNPNTGNQIKNAVLHQKLAEFLTVELRPGRVMLLTLTPAGEELVHAAGETVTRSGRAGMEHEFWRQRLKERCERRGYEVTEEYHLGEGKRVDLMAQKGERRFLIEIETGKSDIHANVAKCETTGATTIVFFIAAVQSLPDDIVVLTPETIDTINDIL